MPLYEYACPDCHERFEVLQRMGDGAEGVRCLACGGEHAERQLSTFAAAVSGGGSSGFVDSGGCGRPACGTGFT